jgi:hypothetical protein
MPEPSTYRQHADELRAQAALEQDRGRRQRYLLGLARSYDELARQHEPERPATAQRAGLVALLRRRGFTEAHIADRLGCTPQRISQLMREAAERR